jgi:hypothetical protein
MQDLPLGVAERRAGVPEVQAPLEDAMMDPLTRTLYTMEADRLMAREQSRPRVYPPGAPREMVVRVGRIGNAIQRRYVDGLAVETRLEGDDAR